MILNIIITLCLLGLLFCYYMLYRNEKVGDFRGKLINIVDIKSKSLIDEGGDWRLPYKIYREAATYNEMLYSTKPLKLENWFTKEEIDFLTKT